MFYPIQERSGYGTEHLSIDMHVLSYLPIGKSEMKDCFVGNSTYQRQLEGESQYFYAFEIEFCLASVGLLLGLAKSGEYCYNLITVSHVDTVKNTIIYRKTLANWLQLE